METKLYVFGMNYNPTKKTDEMELTQIQIPAKSEQEAKERLRVLVGTVVAKKCFLNDIRDY